MPLILYGKETSPPCRAVLVTAKVIGVDLELKDLQFASLANMSETFMKMNPNRTIPTLDDDGFYLWESRPIMSYLVDKYGQDDALYPKDVKARALVDQMLHFDGAALSATIGQYFYPQLFVGEVANREKEVSMREKLTTLEIVLEQSSFAAGEHVTIADIAIVTSLSILSAFGFLCSEYPNIVKYVANVKEKLPVYDQVAKGGEEKVSQFVQSRMRIHSADEPS